MEIKIKLTTISIIFLSLVKLHATEQMRDIIVVDNDTFALKNSPIIGTGLYIRFIANFDTSDCLATGKNRGYFEHWSLENDSLFLGKIISADFVCEGEKHIRFQGRLFADWHTEGMKLPIGDKLPCYICFEPLYKEHRILTFENGRLISDLLLPNDEKIEYYRNVEKERLLTEQLIDTLAGFLSDNINVALWIAMDCDETYLLDFSKNGKLIALQIEDRWYNAETELYPKDKKCLRKLKKALRKFDLSNYDLPSQKFTIRLEIWYWDDKFDVDR